MTKIAMLGLGSMNGAILAGLLGSGVRPEDVTATSRSTASAEARGAQYGIRVIAEEDDAEANRSAAAGADVVFLGVKPPGIAALCEEIAGSLQPGAVVVSVAAGVDLQMLEGALADSAAQGAQPVIRSMPNTPVSVGQGVVGLALGTAVTDQQANRVSDLLTPCGTVYILDESQIDALTGVSGSGPAYAFYLAEQMTAAGTELGLEPDIAADLAAQTICGAGRMLVENQAAADGPLARAEVPEELRRSVSSPNGTTERAIAALDDHGFPAAAQAAVRASAHRAAEMTEQLRSGG